MYQTLFPIFHLKVGPGNPKRLRKKKGGILLLLCYYGGRGHRWKMNPGERQAYGPAQSVLQQLAQ